MADLKSTIRAVFLYVSAALGCLCAVSAPAHAEPFSWQLSGGVIENGYGGSFDSRATSVDATYYLDAIDDARGPFALASFLNPTTRISASASETSSFFNDPRTYSVGGRYVWSSTGWYAGGYYSKDDPDNPTTFLENSKGLGALIGKYLGERTTLELGVGRSERRGEQQSALFSYTVEDDADVMSLDVLHVRTFRSLTYALHGAISTRDTEESVFQVFPTPPVVQWSVAGPRARSFAVGGELFPTARLGIRVGYSTVGTANMETDSYDLAATWFFKPRIAMQFGFNRSSLDDIAIGDVDRSSIRFIGRF